MNQPSLLNETDKYSFDVNDFPLTLDRFIFSAIYNLYTNGANKICALDVKTLLDDNLVAKNLIEKENGFSFLQDCEMNSNLENFYYYYNRLKKISLIRDLEKSGYPVSNIYSENPLDENYTKINAEFDKLTSTDIINMLKGEIAAKEKRYVLNSSCKEFSAAEGIRDLVKSFKEKPEIGCELQGHIFNSITRGGRKGKLYLRSGGSGTGKTRTMVGDACNIAYPFRYDTRKNRWVATGNSEKVLYVMTEQDPEEIKTMILAYLTGYNEEIFIYGTYTEEESKRIEIAIDIMERYEENMKLAQIPDPCSSVIKNLFRRYVLQENVSNIFYDYIFSSPAMLAEYRDLKIREDVALRLLATTIKNLAVELDAFILTSTQVSNDDDPKGGFKDFHNVQGSRAIPNLVDFACIMSRPTKDELMSLGKLVEGYGSLPNVVYDVYKNRRGRWNMVRIWGYSDLGTCRRNDWFVTDTRGKPLKDFSIFNFTNLEKENYDELLALYNTGEVKDESVVQKYKVDQSIKEELLLDLNIKDAFGDNKRYEDNDFSDFL